MCSESTHTLIEKEALGKTLSEIHVPLSMSEHDDCQAPNPETIFNMHVSRRQMFRVSIPPLLSTSPLLATCDKEATYAKDM